MTIALKLSSEQEQRLRAGAAQQDARAVREILSQAMDSTVEELLRASARPSKASTLSAVLDEVAEELRDAPALSDQAISRAGIYADHP
jgi:vacuolar-type H+-ATPase subunit E/Vma4